MLSVVWYFWHSNRQKQTAICLANPAIGDVYTIEENDKEGTIYTFMRVAAVKGDSVFMPDNNIEYGGFVSDLADDDYFTAKDTLVFSNHKLTAMREDATISQIRRGYGRNAGFNRIKPENK